MTKVSHYALLLLVSLFAVSANGAPMAYSVNSDSGDESNEDSLYLIDLATGNDQIKGKLYTGVEYRRDTEGLAIDTSGDLWGIDDDSRTLFQINKDTGSITFGEEISFPGFPPGGSNDFGMTFDCDNTLYVSSVITRTLYKLDLEGGMEVIGSEGAMGVNISAIAAIGNPTMLYGLGNGQFQNGTTDSPNLYSIDLDTGVASLIGPLGAAGEYNQGGLAFDNDGNLWAITDRRVLNEKIVELASEILSIDVDFGTATLISTTVNEVGFESLAIGSPAACSVQQVDEDRYPGIPTLNTFGRLLSIFALMFAGTLILRRRIS